MHIFYLNNLWFKSGGVKQKAQGPKWASKDSYLLNWTALKNVNYRNVCFVVVGLFLDQSGLSVAHNVKGVCK